MTAISFLSPGRMNAVVTIDPPDVVDPPYEPPVNPTLYYNVDTMIENMGAVAPYVIMGSASDKDWATGAVNNRGFRTYGDSLYDSYLRLLQVLPNPSQSYDWPVWQPWHLCYPGTGNTTTNVCVRIQNMQGYWMHKDTHVWSKINPTKLYAKNNKYKNLSGPSGGGNTTAAKFFSSGADLVPGFPFVPLASDRAAPSSVEAVYKALHSVFDSGGTVYRFVLPETNRPDGGKLGGLMLACDVDLFTTDGQPFNGTTEILMQLGSDFLPSLNSNQGSGDMDFAGTTGGWTPNNCSSKLCYITPTIGVKTRVHNVTYTAANKVDTTSVYAQAGGVMGLTHQQLIDYPIEIL